MYDHCNHVRSMPTYQILCRPHKMILPIHMWGQYCVSTQLFSRNGVLSRRENTWSNGDLIYISNQTGFGLDTWTSEVVVLKYIHTLQVSRWNIKKIGGNSSSRTHAVNCIVFFSAPLYQLIFFGTEDRVVITFKEWCDTRTFSYTYDTFLRRVLILIAKHLHIWYRFFSHW